MENKKQSSVEWLNRWFIDNPEATYEEGKSALKKAKAMHQQEIEDAWLNGMKGEMIAPFAMNRYKPEAQEYYNETFGGNNE